MQPSGLWGAEQGIRAAGPQAKEKPLVPAAAGNPGKLGMGAGSGAARHRGALQGQRGLSLGNTLGAKLPGHGRKTPNQHDMMISIGPIFKAVRRCE